MPRKAAEKKVTSDTVGKVCLITGGCGFVGQHIASMLHDKGHEIILFDRIDLKDPRYRVITGDLTNESDMLAACRGVDAVFHVAAVITNGRNEALMQKVNVEGTKTVIRHAKRRVSNNLSIRAQRRLFSTGKTSFTPMKPRRIPQIPGWLRAHQGRGRAAGARRKRCRRSPDVRYPTARHLWSARQQPDANAVPHERQAAAGAHWRRRNVVPTLRMWRMWPWGVLALERLQEGSPVCGQAYFVTNGEPVRCAAVPYKYCGGCLPLRCAVYSMWGFMERIIYALSGKRLHFSLPHWLMIRVGRVVDVITRLTGRGPDFLTPYKVRDIQTHILIRSHTHTLLDMCYRCSPLRWFCISYH